MTGYVRKDTTNNIADGNVINAADLDSEFDGVQAAFNSSTGHTHDGTASEGAPITKLGPVQDVTISTTVLGVKTTNTVDLGTSSLKFKDFYLAGNASIGGTLTYGGVTLSNAVTGTGNMVLSASPTITGTITAAAANFSGAVAFNGTTTIGDADTDTITQAASYVTGTQLKSAKTATNTLSLAAYDVDGTAYTNLITLTASNTPTLALTSTGVGSMDNIAIGATTASTGAFTTLSANSTVTLSGGTANGVAYLNGSKVVTTGSALVFDGTNFTAPRTQVTTSGTPPSSGAGLEFVGGATPVILSYNRSTSQYLPMTQYGSAFTWSINGGSSDLVLTSTGLGIGTSSPGAKLDVSGSNAGSVLQSRILNTSTSASSDAQQFIYVNGGIAGDPYTTWTVAGVTSWSAGIRNSDSDSWYLSPGGNLGTTPSLVVTTSGNLGIGTSSPAGKLTVDPGNTSGTQIDGLRLPKNFTAQANFVAWQQGANGWRVGIPYGDNTYPLAFYYGASTPTASSPGTQLMTLDASGNLGLGVTPSAWASGFKTIQLGAITAVTGAGTTANFSANQYWNGTNNIYLTSAAATLYQQSAGAHYWYNAASGTAGNAITFTQAMTLDSSGNLGIGETSPSTFGKLVVKSGTINLVTDTATQRRLSFWSTSNGNSENAYIQVQNDGATTNTGEISFATRNSGGTLAERARIDASGNLLVGGTSNAAGARLISENASGNQLGLRYTSVATWYNSVDSSGNYIWTKDGTNIARFDSSGNLLVGKTSAGNSINGAQLSSTYQIFTNTSDYISIFNRRGTDGVSVYFQKAETNVGTISVTTVATTFNSLSDYRLKNITGSLTGAKDFIMALQPKQGTWKADGSKFVGFLAHEFQEVSPSSVTGEKDAVDADGKPIMQSMQASSAEVMANLVAFVQELKAEIDSLKSQLNGA